DVPAAEGPGTSRAGPEGKPGPLGAEIEEVMRRCREQLRSDPGVGRTLVPLPVPPNLAEAFGYRGEARFVAFRWEPAGDELVYDDGRLSGTGDPWTFLAYRRHAKVTPHLKPYNLGHSDIE